MGVEKPDRYGWFVLVCESTEGHLHWTAAGNWYALVSIPIFQFILLRWYFRFFVWFRFLWQISRIHLNLIPTHPDRAAGLAFLGKSAYAFSLILFAQGALLAGVIASHVLYNGEALMSFKIEPSRTAALPVRSQTSRVSAPVSGSSPERRIRWSVCWMRSSETRLRNGGC